MNYRMIIIPCPATGVPVSTGFRAATGTDLTGLKRMKMVRCPACLGNHEWNGEGAYCEEEEPDPTFMDLVRSIWRRPKHIQNPT
jgi:hypothetical protein